MFTAVISKMLSQFQRSSSLALNNRHDDPVWSECKGKALGFEANRAGFESNSTIELLSDLDELVVHLFLHSLSKNLSSTCWVPDVVPGT